VGPALVILKRHLPAIRRSGLSPHRTIQHACSSRCKGYVWGDSHRLLRRSCVSSHHCPRRRSLTSDRLSGILALQTCIYYRLYPKDRGLNKVMVRCILFLHERVHDPLMFTGRCCVVSGEAGFQRITMLSTAFENVGHWMPHIRVSYVLLLGNISSQTLETSRIEDTYQCEYRTTSNLPTFSPPLDAAPLQYVASP